MVPWGSTVGAEHRAARKNNAQGTAPLRRLRTDTRPPLGNLIDNSTTIQPLSNPAQTIGNFNPSATVRHPPPQPFSNRLTTTFQPPLVRFSQGVRPTFCRTHSPTSHPHFTYSAHTTHPDCGGEPRRDMVQRKHADNVQGRVRLLPCPACPGRSERPQCIPRRDPRRGHAPQPRVVGAAAQVVTDSHRQLAARLPRFLL